MRAKERILMDWPALNYNLAYSPDGRAWQLTFGGGEARSPDDRPRARGRRAVMVAAGRPPL